MRKKRFFTQGPINVNEGVEIPFFFEDFDAGICVLDAQVVELDSLIHFDENYHVVELLVEMNELRKKRGV